MKTCSNVYLYSHKAQDPGLRTCIPHTLAICVMFSCVLCPESLEAFPFEDARPLYVGSRPLGMGNAFTALADDAEGGF